MTTVIYTSSPMRVSVTNLLATAPLSAFISEQTAFPVVNTRAPQRQLAPWKTIGGNGTTAFTVWDLAAIPPVNTPGFLAAVVNTNASLIYVQSYLVYPGTIQFTGIYPTVLDPITGRRHAGVWFRTWPWRYIELGNINSGTIQDGQLTWQIGGLHFGPCLQIPHGLLARGMTIGPVKPRTFQASLTNAIEDYQDRGPARTHITAEFRLRNIGRGDFSSTDALGQWHAFNRQWGGRPAAVMLTNQPRTVLLGGGPGQAWIMRNLAALDANRALTSATAQLDLIETYGP